MSRDPRARGRATSPQEPTAKIAHAASRRRCGCGRGSLPRRGMAGQSGAMLPQEARGALPSRAARRPRSDQSVPVVRTAAERARAACRERIHRPARRHARDHAGSSSHSGAVEAIPQTLEAAAHPRLDSAERLSQMLGELGVRLALEKGQSYRLLLTRFERVDASPDRARVRAGEQHLQRSRILGGDHHAFFLIVHRYGFQFAPAQLIQAAIADDAGQPRQRLALGGDVRPGVVPDVDKTLLQDLLGRSRFPQYTQRHGVQMRRGQAVELREGPLILERGARQQLHQARVALELLLRVALHADRLPAFHPRWRSFRQRTSAWPASRLSTRASTKSRSESRFTYLRTGSRTVLDALRCTSERSARRHTVRAMCARLAARVPPGRMNSLSGRKLALKRSTASSRRRTCASLMVAWPGIDNSPPR